MSGVTLGKQRVDPRLVITLITDPRFVLLVSAVKREDVYWVQRLSDELDAEFGASAVLAAMEKVG